LLRDVGAIGVPIVATSFTLDGAINYTGEDPGFYSFGASARLRMEGRK
jgi:hypothetical protein